MKAIMLMFDSLNRNMLAPYGCDWTQTPNFSRLAEHTVRFDNCYAGSLPCMPARRELHTGRYNFLHRSWGPMEPYDDSMPQILKNNGIYTHLVSDHTHYWEDGGSTYHNRYSSWENIRGQEGDKWKCLPPLLGEPSDALLQNRDGQYFQATGDLQRHDSVNRCFMQEEPETCLARTLACGTQFIDANHDSDNWFLQIECFDPHEPFFVPERYKDLYPDDYQGKTIDWPPYHHVTEDPVTADHLKKQYAALLTMCDTYLGKLLDKMDAYDMWKDTLLIVNTDHGYLLGEHGWWSKIVMPCYDEIVHTPLFIHDPRFDCDGQSRSQIVQTIDIPATLLEFFGQPLPADMQGKPIRSILESGAPIRDYALFGIHGAHVSIFDGRYVYMKSPISEQNKPLYEYTLMPMHMRNLFSPDELKNAVLAPGDTFSFLKGCPVLKLEKGNGNGARDFSDILINGKNSEDAKHIDNNSMVNAVNFGDKLFDMELDPRQTRSISDPELEARLAGVLVAAMKENDCPPEQFARIGLPADRPVTPADITAQKALMDCLPDILETREWTRGGINTYRALMKFIPKSGREEAARILSEQLQTRNGAITADTILCLVRLVIPAEYMDMVTYFIGLSGRTE